MSKKNEELTRMGAERGKRVCVHRYHVDSRHVYVMQMFIIKFIAKLKHCLQTLHMAQM